jgi:hypothetical protein
MVHIPRRRDASGWRVMMPIGRSEDAENHQVERPAGNSLGGTRISAQSERCPVPGQLHNCEATLNRIGFFERARSGKIQVGCRGPGILNIFCIVLAFRRQRI